MINFKYLQSEMESRNSQRNRVKEMMRFSSTDLIEKPNVFDWPEINYEHENNGWKAIAECIVGPRYKFMKQIYKNEAIRNRKPKGVIKYRRNGFLPTKSQYINYRRNSQEHIESKISENKEDQEMKKIVEESEKPMIKSNQKKSSRQRKSKLSLIKLTRNGQKRHSSKSQKNVNEGLPELKTKTSEQIKQNDDLATLKPKTLSKCATLLTNKCVPLPLKSRNISTQGSYMSSCQTASTLSLYPHYPQLDQKIQRYLKHRIRIRQFSK